MKIVKRSILIMFFSVFTTIVNKAGDDDDLRSEEELKKYHSAQGRAAPSVGGDIKENHYVINKSGVGSGENHKGCVRQFSDAQISVDGRKSSSNKEREKTGSKKKKKSSQEKDLSDFFFNVGVYIARAFLKRSGTITLYNIKSHWQYEFWVDDSKLDFRADNSYTVAAGEHVIKIRRFGYDDIVFRANVGPRSNFKVDCHFKQSPFYCFDLCTSDSVLNPVSGDTIFISFDVNRNVIGKKVVCEIKNVETGETVFTREFSDFTTFTQKFTFYGKRSDGAILPDGKYSVNVIYDDNVLSEYVTIDSTLDTSLRGMYKKILFFGFIPENIRNHYTLQNGSCYGNRFPCNNSACLLNNIRLGGYLNKGKQKFHSIFISLPIYIANIGFSINKDRGVEIPIKFRLMEFVKENSFKSLLSMSLAFTCDLNKNKQQPLETVPGNLVPIAQDNSQEKQNPFPFLDCCKFIAALFYTWEYRDWLVVDVGLRFSEDERSFICLSYKRKEMDVVSVSVACDLEAISASYLHRFEFTYISFGFDLRICFRELKKSYFSLKFLADA